MALFDVDKNSEDRSSPSVNSHDNLVSGAFMARGATSMNYTTVNPNTAGNKAIQLGLGRLVQVTNFTLISTGSPQTIASTAHGLNFTPNVTAALNGATVGAISNVDIQLPCFISANITGGAVQITDYLFYYVDATNVYIHYLSGDGTPITINGTFYCYQQRAAK